MIFCVARITVRVDVQRTYFPCFFRFCQYAFIRFA